MSLAGLAPVAAMPGSGGGGRGRAEDGDAFREILSNQHDTRSELRDLRTGLDSLRGEVQELMRMLRGHGPEQGLLTKFAIQERENVRMGLEMEGLKRDLAADASRKQSASWQVWLALIAGLVAFVGNILLWSIGKHP